jgi:hypothetical protein
VPYLVMIFKFFEFNTSSFDTMCRIFTFFLIIILLINIGHSYNE